MVLTYFILVCIFWGGSYFAINISLTGFSPFLAAAIRVAIAALLSLAYMKTRGRHLQIGHLAPVIINGAIGVGIPWALLFWGEQHVQPALASIIIATSPLFTLLFIGPIAGRDSEPITRGKKLGIVLGMVGIAVIFMPSISRPEGALGIIAIIGTAICYGISVAWLKKLAPHVDNASMLFLECIGALSVLVPISLAHGFSAYFLTGEPLLKPLAAIFYLGICSTFIAFILFYKLVRAMGGTGAATTTYLVPIVSIIIDGVVSKKWIGFHEAIGAIIIFIALGFVHKTSRLDTEVI